MSPCVTHLNRKPVFSCCTVIFLLSVGNSLKPFITCTSVNLRKALVTRFPVQQMHSNFKPSRQIDTRHIKVPQNKFKLTKYVGNKKRFPKKFFLSVLHNQTSVESL